MLNYILRRLLFLIPLLLAISIVVFFMIHLIPGDPVQIMLGDKGTAEDAARLRTELGLDKPLHVQYFKFLSNLLKGDLGRSIRNRNPVINEIGTSFPATIELTILSMIVASVIGVIAGIISAIKQYSLIDNVTMVAALLGISMPVFWVGMMLMLIFASRLGWLPISGRISRMADLNVITNFYIIDSIITSNWAAFKSTISHLILPALTLATIPVAMIARMTRSTTLEVLNQDYIRTARAKGLPEKIVITKHVLKNSLIPVVTIIGLQFGSFLGGAVLTETVFARAGVGRLLINGILGRDFPVIQGAVLFIATFFVFINLIVDLLYSYLDPRIHYS
ncbi:MULTISPECIES: ABC transporter permease [unclassified Halanaerobium]|uniref:ABC transporter permease n=1 Tax=unclassified Halanaerobium TaxID=2641197 RepID=UPI000DF3598A|nr:MULTISPECIES: ABC transporter permease [unclassified Halanaerobium]RCW50673.1 peptide/nickel transport system permease protein [Halanaerobium sp. MA284_MarDTE_T2]RCW86841.1 peptide/nickel transport system permease protein [Halanaerobium sp. DL-01]